MLQLLNAIYNVCTITQYQYQQCHGGFKRISIAKEFQNSFYFQKMIYFESTPRTYPAKFTSQIELILHLHTCSELYPCKYQYINIICN